MKANLPLRWILVLLLGMVSCNVSSVVPVDTRCLEAGGQALCTEPTNVPLAAPALIDKDMWTYGLCDLDGPFPWRAAAWNKVLGGKPVFDADIVPKSTEFEKLVVNQVCELNATDTGWGITIPDNILCWSGPPLYKNRSTIRDFRGVYFSGFATTQTGCNAPWKDTVYAIKVRDVGCPNTYNQRTLPNGDLECWKLPPECSDDGKERVGNPIVLLDGCKSQREVDYRSRTPSGVEVERYYNSGGYFRFDAAPSKATDVWRTTWDRRILVPPVAGRILAYAQRADGSLQAFLPNGQEIHNNQGGASAVLERLTDAGAVTKGWRLTTANRDVELYGVTGLLLKVSLRNGRTHALVYGANGQLATVTDSFGGVVTFTYDASGRMSGFVAPGNRTYVYGYDTLGRLISVTYPDATVRTYHYENVGFIHGLTGITDEKGVRFATWTYESGGRANSSQHAGGADAVTLYYGSYSAGANEGTTGVVDALGTSRSYYYEVAGGVARVKRVSLPNASTMTTHDDNGNVVSYSDFNRNLTTYTYDLTRNLEISRTEAAGTALARTITTQWHPLYRLPTKITAPSGVSGVVEVTDVIYDTQGNVLQKTITAGANTRQWNSTYSALGQMLTVDGPRTDVADLTTYTYYGVTDPCVGCRGNVKTMTNAIGHVTTYKTYDADGQPTLIVDPNNVVTTMSYDLRGRLKSRVVSGESTAFGYDNAGQLSKVLRPDGSFLRYQYDAAHRLTELVDSFGNIIQYTLDAMGNRIKEDVFDPSDHLVKTQRRTFDGLNRLYNDIGAAGQLSAYQYDDNGNLKTAVDPLNRSTTSSYDAMNRLVASTDAGGGVTRYGYDAKDRLASVGDPINLTTTYSYDGLGNLTQLASPDTGIATYVADAAGNVIGATDARGATTSYTYDALNRQTRASFVGGAVALEYDNGAIGGFYAKGRLTKITDPSGTTTYGYDANGRVLSKTQTVTTDGSTKSFTVSYRYVGGRIAGVTYPSGKSVNYTYDAKGRIVSVQMAPYMVSLGTVTWMKFGPMLVQGVEYFPFGGVQAWTWGNLQTYRRGWDADGRIASLSLGPDSANYADESWMFGYDGLNRLTSATLAQGEMLAYSYDRNGNRQQETRARGTTIYGQEALMGATSNYEQEALAGATTNYGYGAGSNRLVVLSGAVTKNYSYDAAGNITGNGSVNFTYDGRGRLTQVSNGYRYAINRLGQRVAKIGPPGITYFAYDEQGHLIGEYDQLGKVLQEIIYLGDTPVVSLRPAGGGDVYNYSIYTDHLNSPRLITDSSGRNRWEWKIDSFGAGAPNEDPSGVGTFTFNLRFPGQYYDAETGLHYNYFRDYDPSVGRYVESDPIGLKGGANTYAYVDGSAIGHKDPFGLATYMCRQPLDACANPGRQRCFADIPGNPFYHQYLCVIQPNGNITCGGQDRSGNPFSSPGKPSEDYFPYNRKDLCEKKDDRQCVDNCIQRRVLSSVRPRYGIPFGTDCQEWSDDALLQCQTECKSK